VTAMDSCRGSRKRRMSLGNPAVEALKSLIFKI
jgi:hypothetical protein